MPIYEYKCRKCGRQFEVLQNITDDDVKRCKYCKGPVDKLMSLSSFHLKGSGWYVTDYGGKKPSTGEKHEETSPSTPKESKETSSPSAKSEKTGE